MKRNKSLCKRLILNEMTSRYLRCEVELFTLQSRVVCVMTLHCLRSGFAVFAFEAVSYTHLTLPTTPYV